jgi:hypothetical protein
VLRARFPGKLASGERGAERRRGTVYPRFAAKPDRSFFVSSSRAIDAGSRHSPFSHQQDVFVLFVVFVVNLRGE